MGDSEISSTSDQDQSSEIKGQTELLSSPSKLESQAEYDAWGLFLLSLENDDVGSVKKILKAQPNLLLSIDQEGKSLIELSIFFNAYNAFTYLVRLYSSGEHWEIINKRSDKGLNPLLRVARKCRNDGRDNAFIIDLLTNDLSEDEVEELRENGDLDDMVFGWRFEFSLCEEDAIKYVNALIKAGANPLIKGNYNGRMVSWKSFIDKEKMPRLYSILKKYSDDFLEKHFLNVLVGYLKDDKAVINQLKNSYKKGEENSDGLSFEDAKKTVLNNRLKYVYEQVEKNRSLLDTRTSNGQNAFHVSILDGNYDLFRLILNLKYPDTVDLVFLETRPSKFFMETTDVGGGADLDELHIDDKDYSGRTALFLAIDVAKKEEEALDYVRDLLVKGANPNLPDSNGVMPLQLAAKKGFGRIIRALVYSVISSYEIEDVISDDGQEKALKKNVADVNPKGPLGLTFLHCLFEFGYIGLMDIFRLEKGGFDPKILALFAEKDNEGESPLHIGMSSKNMDVRKKTISFIKQSHDELHKILKNLKDQFNDCIEEPDESFDSLADDECLLKVNARKFGQFNYALMKFLKSIGRCHDVCEDDYSKEQNDRIGLMSLIVSQLIYDLRELVDLSEANILSDEDGRERAQRGYNRKKRRVLREFLRLAMSAQLNEGQKILLVKTAIAACNAFLLDDILLDRYINQFFPEVGNYLDVDDSDLCSDQPSQMENESNFSEFFDDNEGDPLELHEKINDSNDENYIIAFLKKEDPGRVIEMLRQEDVWGDYPINIAVKRGLSELSYYLYGQMKQYGVDVFQVNNFGTNFLHDAFNMGSLNFVSHFQNDDYFFNPDFYQLMRQNDGEGHSPLYLGMISKSKKARKSVKTFTRGIINLVDEKIDTLVDDMNVFLPNSERNNVQLLQLQVILRKLIGRARFFSNIRYEISRQHNTNMVLLYLSVLELMGDMKQLGELKANAEEEDADRYTEMASDCINKFLKNVYDETHYDELLDILITLALVAGALVAGVGVGFLIGAFIAWSTGITSIVFLGLSAFEIGGASIGGVAAPVATFLLSHKFLFGFSKDSSQLGELTSDVVQLQEYGM